MAPSRPQNPSHLSFFEVLRQHSTKLLYREPLKWTQEHLDIFQCSFSMNENKSDTVDNSGLSLSEMSADALYRQNKARRLAVSRSWCSRGCAMEDLMKPYTGEHIGGNVFFLFDRDDAIHNYWKRFPIYSASVRVEGPVSIGSIDLQYAERSRKRLVEWRPRSDDVMLNVGKRRYARVKPANYLHDPLIAATAIGLAQQQGYSSGTPSPTCNCQVHHVHVLAYKDRQHLYVYTTSISSAFLDLLEYPSKRPWCSKSACRKIHFQITPISYKPYHSLHVRMSSVLGLKELEDNKVQCTQGAEKGQAKELGKEDGSRAVKQQQPSQSSDAPATKQPLQSRDAPATKRPWYLRNAPAAEQRQPLQSRDALINKQRQPLQSCDAPATKQPLQSCDAPATKQPLQSYNAPATKQPLQSCDAPATKRQRSLQSSNTVIKQQQPLQSRNALATKQRQPLQSRDALVNKQQQPLQSSNTLATKQQQPLQSCDTSATKRPWYLRNAPAAKKTISPLSINMNAANRMLR